MKQLLIKNNSGFVTLISVIILTVVSVAIVISILMTGISSGKNSRGLETGIIASMYATTCTEVALNRIRLNGVGTEVDDGFSDSLEIDAIPDVGIEAGGCDFTVIDNGGESRSIQATGYSGISQDVIRRILVEITTISPSIVIQSWQEVDSF